MIIGVSGAAGSGKDEFAKVGIAEFGFERRAFADPLKEEIAEFLTRHAVDWDINHLHGSIQDKERILSMTFSKRPRKKEYDWFLAEVAEYNDGRLYFSARKLMQYWGTEYRRKDNPNYWVHRTFDSMEVNKNYIITDVRFPNELLAVKDVEGRLIRIERPNLIKISGSTHASESLMESVADWDFLIPNTGTLEEYHEQCRQVLKELLHE